MDINKVFLMGNLTADPKVFGERGNVISFTIACNAGKDKDGNDRVNYVPVKAFGKTAEWAPQMTKGSRVMVDGYVTTEKYEGKDGKAVYSVSVVAWQIQAIVGRPKEGSNTNQRGYSSSSRDDSDVPF